MEAYWGPKSRSSCKKAGACAGRVLNPPPPTPDPTQTLRAPPPQPVHWTQFAGSSLRPLHSHTHIPGRAQIPHCSKFPGDPGAIQFVWGHEGLFLRVWEPRRPLVGVTGVGKASWNREAWPSHKSPAGPTVRRDKSQTEGLPFGGLCIKDRAQAQAGYPLQMHQPLSRLGAEAPWRVSWVAGQTEPRRAWNPPHHSAGGEPLGAGEAGPNARVSSQFRDPPKPCHSLGGTWEGPVAGRVDRRSGKSTRVHT